MICIEVRHAKAVLSARVNKTDRNDARGIAQMMRVGLYRPVHVKTLESQEIRSVLQARRFVLMKLRDAENSIRGLMRNYGLKVGVITRNRYERRVQELLDEKPEATAFIEPLLAVRRVLLEQYAVLHKKMMDLAASDDVCHLLMTAPGVGPLVALR